MILQRITIVFSLLLFYHSASFGQKFLAIGYPKDYHGTILPDGARYSKFKNTGACNFIPPGSEILITEEKTKRSALVRVNDVIEEGAVDFILSDAVYEELGYDTDDQLIVEYRMVSLSSGNELADVHSTNQFRIKGDTSVHCWNHVYELSKEIPEGAYSIQMASFTQFDNAMDYLLKPKHHNLLYYLEEGKAQGKKVYRVLIGSFSNKVEVESIAKKLELKNAIIRKF